MLSKRAMGYCVVGNKLPLRVGTNLSVKVADDYQAHHSNSRKPFFSECTAYGDMSGSLP